jgi:hypothetical protein
MQSGVKRIHEISQNKLKGMPNGIGCMRSQRDTEKHIPTKGISPNRIAPSDGFRIESSLRKQLITLVALLTRSHAI